MKAIILDVDDTVCESTKHATIEMLEELERLHNSLGLKLAFISGSTIDQICNQLFELRAKAHIFGGSGTQYAIFEHGFLDRIYCEELSMSDKHTIFDALNDLVYTHDIVPITDTADQIQYRGSQITLSALGRNAPSDLKRKFDPDCKKRKEWIEYLHEKFPIMNNYTIRYGGTTSLDITIKGRDKLYGLDQFIERNDLSYEEVLFVGDKLDPGGNDYCICGKVFSLKVSNCADTLSLLKRMV